MNTVVLNGTSSSSLRGLLIQRLPPISKPPIRVMTDEIDGVDGDITTPLGYGAYDKEILIGLHGSFDINAVIAFFDSAGEVTFSNEPDKVYRYKILQQIDYERLVRFRTAIITFHVQPFKYLKNEPLIEETFVTDDENVTVTNSGNIYSKPLITLNGTGTVNLYIGDVQILAIALGTSEAITLDVESLDAYYGASLKNRQITGDMEKLVFPPGESVLSWTGTVSYISISRYCRWI